MADEKNDLFGGLDLLLEQPVVLDIDQFNKNTVENLDDSKETKDDKGNPDLKKDDKKVDDGKLDVTAFIEKKDDLIDDAASKDNPDTVDENKDKLTVWADYFKEEELLTEEELKDFDGSLDSLKTAFKTKYEKEGLEMVEDYKSQLPDVIKYLAENWEEGVPLDELIDIKSNQIRYSSIDEAKLEDENAVELRKSVIRQYYKETSDMSDTKIEKLIKTKIDLGEDIEEAKENLAELKKFEAKKEVYIKEQAKKQRIADAEAQDKRVKSYEKTVKETKEIIPGLKITEKEQKDILSKIVNPSFDKKGNPISYLGELRAKNAYKFDTALTYLATITMNKEGEPFSDWSKITSKAASEAAKNISKLIENSDSIKGTKDNIKTSKEETLLEKLARNAKK